MKKKEQGELVSLTAQPLTDFTVEELEERLETDPLFLGNVLGFDDSRVSGCNCNDLCESDICEHTCDICYGIYIDMSDCPDQNCTPVYSCPDNVFN